MKVAIQKLTTDLGSSAPGQSRTLINWCITIITGPGHRLEAMAFFGYLLKNFDQGNQIRGYNLITPRTRSPTWKLVNSSATGYRGLSVVLSCSSR